MKKMISIRMVHVLAVILFACAALMDSEHCPPADNISPCMCHGDPDITDVICNNMTTVDYLRKALGGRHFKAPIPKLVITNLHSSMLPSDGLGDIKVRDLEILDGNMPHIDIHAFRSQHLVSLRLKRIRLEDVTKPEIHYTFWQLKKLSMSVNAITKLGHRSLTILSKIQELSLSQNQISEIATISLPTNVQTLWISHNMLTTFNRSLHYTKKLLSLFASYNLLTSIKGELDGVPGLKWLELNHNKISDISDSFSNLTSLRQLSLVGNGIREIGEALVNLKNLKRLNLAHNAITNLNRTVFENLIYLYELNLSLNPLTAFQFCPTLTPLRSLRELKIVFSNLRNLSADCFDRNTNLGFVNLSRNQLSTLGLRYATHLVTLDISFNNFRTLNNLDLPEAGFTTLMLEDNQWPCSRETTSLLKDLDMRGYQFPNGYPGCLPISEKDQTCLILVNPEHV